MKICVYMGSRDGSNPAYRDNAVALGQEMVKRGHGLVYGGASSGLMGAVADQFVEAGAETYGVIPEALYELEVAHKGLTELVITSDMHQRKKAMLERADAFIALPGGLGTFEELFEALTWQQLGYHTKPVGLLNVDGYFDLLLEFLDRSVRSGFVTKHHREALVMDSEINGLLDKIETTEVIYIPKNAVPPARSDKVN